MRVRTAWWCMWACLLCWCWAAVPWSWAGKREEASLAPAPAVEAKAKARHPRLWLQAADLARLRRLARQQAPAWRRLIAWAQEYMVQPALPRHGPGLALAARVLADGQPEQARRLGEAAVNCALAGAVYGRVAATGPRWIRDPRRRGSPRELLARGYDLVAPARGERSWRVVRYSPTRIYLDPEGPPLKGGLKEGDTYLLLQGKLPAAARTVIRVALTLDWAWDYFSPAQRKGVAAWLVGQARVLQDRGRGCFDRTATAALAMTTLAAVAAQGLHPGASALWQQALRERFAQSIRPCLEKAGAGGGWFEGDELGAAAGLDLLYFAAAVKSATGRDLTPELPWFRDRLSYLIFSLLPATARGQGGGRPYRRVAPGCGDRALPPREVADRVRQQMLMLLWLRPEDPAAGWARNLLWAQAAAGMAADHRAWCDLLWLQPDKELVPLTTAPLLQVAPAVGRAVSRSDWTSWGSWLVFWCGPHYARAQHLAAGSFSLFRRGWLVRPGGAYDGATSPHALNYAIRTLAYNTVVIPDPREYSWYDLREGPQPKGTYANDGGQRAWARFDARGRPRKQAPWTASAWEGGPRSWRANREIYDVARITGHQEKPRFAYLRGELTRAYDGSTHKARRVVRHLFHLRPGGPQDALAAEVVVVVDDIEVARPELPAAFVLHLPVRPAVAELEAVGDRRWRSKARRLRMEAGGARLEVVSLGPAPTHLALYGPPAADCWVEGRNWPARGGRKNPAPWRAEFVAEGGRGLHRSLVHCLLPAEAGDPAPPSLSPLETEEPRVVGVVVHDQLWPRVVAVRLGEPSAQAEVSYRWPGGRSRHLVAGLVPNRKYRVEVAQGRVRIAPGEGLRSSPAGALAFLVVPGARPAAKPTAADR